MVLPNDPDLVDILAKNGVDISVSEGEQQGNYVALLGNLLFPLIAFGGLFFLFRGAGGQVRTSPEREGIADSRCCSICYNASSQIAFWSAVMRLADFGGGYFDLSILSVFMVRIIHDQFRTPGLNTTQEHVDCRVGRCRRPGRLRRTRRRRPHGLWPQQVQVPGGP